MCKSKCISEESISHLKSIIADLQDNINDTASWCALFDWGTDEGQWESGVKDRLESLWLKAWTLREAMMFVAPTKEGRIRLEDIQFFTEYAEPGYLCTSGVIAAGNWNKCSKYANKERIVTDSSSKQFGDMLEKMGIDIEWSDEWSSCNDCNGLVRTQPDGNWWEPHYHILDGEILCSECYEKQRDDTEEVEENEE